MADNPLLLLRALGQSVWYDNIHRGLLASGDIRRLVERGEITGITSNPTIFDKAVSGSAAYDERMFAILRETPRIDSVALYETLAVEDIQSAADVLHPVFEATDGGDGYVSIEVSPHLAHDGEGTIVEARRLASRIGRPNVMIKVPATAEGIPAVRTLIAEGIPTNVTLIFSISQYEATCEAYLEGLEQRVAEGKGLSSVASVASFFVSRIDTAVDEQLPDGSPLRGKAAIAQGGVAYAHGGECS